MAEMFRRNKDGRNIHVQQTADGGYILVGSSFSNDGDIKTIMAPLLPRCLDSEDRQRAYHSMQHSFGGSYDEYALAVRQTGDGGYVVAGSTYSNDGDVSGHHGAVNTADVWVFN